MQVTSLFEDSDLDSYRGQKGFWVLPCVAVLLCVVVLAKYVPPALPPAWRHLIDALRLQHIFAKINI